MKFKQEKIIPSSIWDFIRLPLTFINGGFTRHQRTEKSEIVSRYFPLTCPAGILSPTGEEHSARAGSSPLRGKVAESRMRGYPLGFTLIEILVVVLIIGILGAIMLPQYQRAVLKSRYAALMPIAKSMAESNEAYYLEHGEYADNAEDLPVQGRMNYPGGTTLEFGTSSEFAYVLATNPRVENNIYVVYQKHSENFPGNIHCEALTEDNLANQVCLSFGGTPLEGSLSGDDYTAYLLAGNPTNGQFPKPCTTEPDVKQACSGCGFMTREATCNTQTGTWEYDGEFDPDTCPSQPQPQTGASCEAGYTGNLTRAATCSEDHTTWEFVGDWSTDNCVKTRTLTRSNCDSYFCYYYFDTGGHYTQPKSGSSEGGNFTCFTNGGCGISGPYSISDFNTAIEGAQMVSSFDTNGNLKGFYLTVDGKSLYYDGSGNFLGGTDYIDTNGNSCSYGTGNCYKVDYRSDGTIGNLTYHDNKHTYTFNYDVNGQNDDAPIKDVTPYYLNESNTVQATMVQKLLSRPHTKCDLYPEIAACQTANSGN